MLKPAVLTTSTETHAQAIIHTGNSSGFRFCLLRRAFLC